MRTTSWIRGCGLVLAVLTLIVSMPELASAQQSGLFPLSPIKRQRVPCDQEDPVYKLYKDKYFGYHPPCWRPFPSGWGCPSPEKPDVEKSFKEIKLGAGGNPPTGEREEMQQGEQPLGRPDIPPLPGGGRSPFEQPVPPGADRPANPAAPRQDQRQPASPFDEPAGAPATNPGPTSAAPRPGRAQPASPLAGEGSPELTAPEQPARLEGTQTSRSPRDDDGPILSVGDITVPPVSDANDAFGAEPASSGTTTADATPAQAAPASSPPRRGFLSGLFNNLGLNWTRR